MATILLETIERRRGTADEGGIIAPGAVVAAFAPAALLLLLKGDAMMIPARIVVAAIRERGN